MFPDFGHDFYHNFLLSATGVDFEADDYGEVAVEFRINIR